VEQVARVVQELKRRQRPHIHTTKRSA
jgi:hypothetical protein